MLIQSSLSLLTKGVIVGLLASIPLGPIGVICIQRTVNKGRLSGFLSGVGAATADTIFAAIAGFSLTFVIAYIFENQVYFQAIGGLVIILLGVKIFFTNPIKQIRKHKRKKNNLVEDYFSILAVTLTNPLAISLFIALFASMGVVSEDGNLLEALISTGGVFVGATIWWYILTGLVNIFRSRFRLKQLWWINKISGSAILLLGVAAIVRLFF